MSVAAISRYVLRHKGQVALVWLAITLAGIGLLPWAISQLTDDFTMPGTESGQANAEIIEKYGNGGYALPLVPVVTLPEGTTVDSPGIREELAAIDQRVMESRPEARVAS